MFLIIVNESSSRLEYIFDILFETILHTQYEVVLKSSISDALEKYPNASIINYTNDFTIPADLSIPNEGLLMERELRKNNPKLIKNDFLRLYFSEKEMNEYNIDFDLFSAAFYLISEYVFYQESKLDKHDRYDEEAYELYHKRYYSEPVLHQYAEWIWNYCYALKPNLTRIQNVFQQHITIDIDHPYLYKGKSIGLHIAGFIKECITLNITAIASRFKYYRSGTDPFDVFDQIADIKTPLAIFFLLDRHCKEDGRHTYHSETYQELIKRFSDHSCTIGIHPSYTAFQSERMIRFEKTQLEFISEDVINAARMHFLKYTLPKTRRSFLKSGIFNDYTSCPIHSWGYKNFMAVPFSWFDVLNNEKTDLIIYPSMLMDVTLKNYLKLSPVDASIELSKAIANCKLHNGVFSIILHNESLSDYGEWKGWKKVFQGLLNS